MFNRVKKYIKNQLANIIRSEWPEIDKLNNILVNTKIGKNVKLYPIYRIANSEIGDYTYVSDHCLISDTKIGKFCSVGPNAIFGWGIHPTSGISTSPMFYSLYRQNGMTLSSENKIQERKEIVIGNDVFIGMNVSILDGVTIGDGAIIGAGAIVSKDIPPYAIAVGSPIRVIKYRFDEDVIKKLLKIKWWDWSDDKLATIEKYFFNIDDFIKKYNEYL